MIPLWLSIPCIILTLTFICHWVLTSDTDWEEVYMIAKGIAVVMIVFACAVVATVSIFQWIGL